jgi:hypothetical protein
MFVDTADEIVGNADIKRAANVTGQDVDPIAWVDAHLARPVVTDRGREPRLVSIPPPSEPDVRISRIRLVWGFRCQGITPFLSSCVIPFFCSTRAAEHSSAPTAYFHRRRAQRRSRTALLQRRRRLVLDGREHGGRLPASGGWPREDPRGACHWPRSNANHACIRLNPRS